ncbi:hypothetical protein EG328_008466 [Venturia inaequalis]|uniref:Uncharacterized protein n=1 Tax=Venturia inaequalis TaxID=5025 RepID=A0A8H3V7H5_VENIN|nr:hypothetical protein EG328_008466 [Venturia inaequalis]KAE9991619.1 hypothetical protein EG327_011315 [Venturia inaequalis]
MASSASTFEAVNEKLVHFTKEIKTLEHDVYHLWFYARPEPARLNSVQSKIADLGDRFLEIKPDLEVLSGSDLGQMLVGLVEEQEAKLAQETMGFDAICDGHHEHCTADWCVSRLVEKFSSIGLAVKELDEKISSNATVPQPLLRVLEDRQDGARAELQRLVEKLSLPEHSTLFDEFNRAILNLWDISHAVDNKLSKLTGKPIIQAPPPPPAANNLNTIRHLNDIASLANLRENVLKAVDEKQLGRTILVYVGALETHAQIHLSMAADSSKKWMEHYEAGVQIGEFRRYLERYQERLHQGRDELLALGELFDTAVQQAEKNGQPLHHLKPDLNKWSSIATQPSPIDDKTDEILNLAGTGAYHYPHQDILQGLQEQTASLGTLRRNISTDIAPGYIRDAMLTHLSAFEKLAAVVEKRDDLFYTRWLTETRNASRRKNELDGREMRLDYSIDAIQEVQDGLNEREEVLDGRGKGLDDFYKEKFEDQVGEFQTWARKAESDLRAREAAVARRESVTGLGCQIL